MANIFDVIISRTTAGDAWALSLPNVRGDGPPRHISCRSNDRLDKYCKKQDQPGRGVFFCVSLIEPGQDRKKEFAVELPALHVDVDFKDHDKPPDEVEAILRALPCAPSRMHHTGNGIHCFWTMDAPFTADEMDLAEELLKKLCEHLGGDPSVAHCVALLRVPGTHNTKRGERKLVRVIKEGREVYTVEQIEAWLDAAREPVLVRRGKQLNAFERQAQEQAFKPPIDVDARLAAMRIGGEGDSSVHATQLSVTASLVAAGVDEDEITRFVLDATKELDGTGDWNWREEERTIRRMCRDFQKKLDAKEKKPDAKKRQPISLSAGAVSLADARKSRKEKSAALASRPAWRGESKGEPRKNMHNARLALDALGIKCRYDVFQSRIFIGYEGDVLHELQDLIGEASDDVVISLRRITSDMYGADFSSELVFDAVRSIALEHRYNPICDELDLAEANWDGQPRLDRMAVDYANAADTPLNRAFIRKTIIAAVRRARQPGCKFDTITVLESPEGWNKSSFWRVLAGDDFYSDQSIIGQQPREIQEQLATVWIHENAELAGMKKAEVETVKAYASRQTDIARPVWGRMVKRQPRHSIDVGSTNSDTYLQSQTGNRRFWPIKVMAPIDLDKLRRDRLQLLGEAAACESRGEEITLDPALWGAAAIEQNARRITDPWEETLADMPTHAVEGQFGNVECFNLAEGQPEEPEYIKIVHRTTERECVATAAILRYVLRVPQERQTAATTMRLSVVMKQLGWEHHANKITIGGKQVRGYSRLLPDRGT